MEVVVVLYVWELGHTTAAFEKVWPGAPAAIA